jgi:tRNA(Ile2) C34 agmatinyltransferase TiaS
MQKFDKGGLYYVEESFCCCKRCGHIGDGIGLRCRKSGGVANDTYSNLVPHAAGGGMIL